MFFGGEVKFGKGWEREVTAVLQVDTYFYSSMEMLQLFVFLSYLFLGGFFLCSIYQYLLIFNSSEMDWLSDSSNE